MTDMIVQANDRNEMWICKNDHLQIKHNHRQKLEDINDSCDETNINI